MSREEGEEQTFIVGIFGDNYDQRKLIGQALGSPDTKSDIELFGRLDANLGYVFSALTPIDYPEKLKPFLQILKISDIHLLVINVEMGLNATAGEILVGMDLSHQLFNTKALILISGINSKTEWLLPDLKKKVINIINTTSLKGTEIFELKQKEDYETLKDKIAEIGLSTISEGSEAKTYLKVLIDHTFPVKGIGTVILGIIKEGTINAGQMVDIIGYDGPVRKVIVRSIQKHDRDFKQAHKGDRVGLALKGNISPKEISRDNLITSHDAFKQEKDIMAEVRISPFYKPKNGLIKAGDATMYHAIVELKSTPFKFTSGNDLIPGNSELMRMQFDKPLVHDGSGLKGIITELSRFDNKLRIVGWFTQII